jgi:hypothetical protein
MKGMERYRQQAGSSACFQNEQANFDKLRYAELPGLLLCKSYRGVRIPTSLVKLK